MQAQADKAHRQHNHHRLDQHTDELAHRRRHRLGLVLHLHQRDACGQRFGNGVSQGSQRLAQPDDVAAFGHRHAQRHHALALVMHLHTGGIGITARNHGNVAQAELVAGSGGARAVARAAKGQRPQLLDRLELARHAGLKYILRRLHRPG